MDEVKPMPPAHVEGGKFHKICLVCRVEFQTNSRNVRFCGDPVKKCQSKHHKARTRRRKQYQANRLFNIIWVQAHKVSRLVMAREVAEGRKTGNCETCEVEGTVKPGDKIEVHHCDGNFLNADPSNLKNQCLPHHRLADSALKKEGKLVTVD